MRRKPFVSWSAMESKRFDDYKLNPTATLVMLRIYDSFGSELVNTETHPTAIKHISTKQFSQMSEKENIELEEFCTEMTNIFKISCGLPID
jgi:hypothetical protein